MINRDINLILAGWNPLNVPGNIAFNEYSIYVNRLITSINENKVLDSLILMLRDMGSDADFENEEILSELLNLKELIISIHNESFCRPV
jgi:hypothetical protein